VDRPPHRRAQRADLRWRQPVGLERRDAETRQRGDLEQFPPREGHGVIMTA
jgi:hypothetical protein